MYSQSALTELSSQNIAGTVLYDPILQKITENTLHDIIIKRIIRNRWMLKLKALTQLSQLVHCCLQRASNSAEAVSFDPPRFEFVKRQRAPSNLFQERHFRGTVCLSVNDVIAHDIMQSTGAATPAKVTARSR